MFGTLGGPEVILILVVALIVFGPRRLPEIGKSMGKMLAEFRKASNDFKRTIEDELEAEKAKEAQAPPLPAPEASPPAVDVTPAEASTTSHAGGVAPEAAHVPATGPPETSDVAPAAVAPEPRLERPAEPVVSRDRPADE